MASWFSWEKNPAIAEFVFQQFGPKTGVDLAAAIDERWGVKLSPGSIRDYCRHRRNREAMADRGVEIPPDMAERQASVADLDSAWPDRRPLPTTETTKELYHLAREMVEKRQAESTAQTQLTCQRHKDSTLPVGVAFWSDWQLGTHGVLMAQLEKDAEAIRDAEGLHVCVMGDLIQNLNQRKHPSSLHECVLPDPTEQEALARYILEIARPKVECLVDGNHEMNTKQASGFTLGPRWAKEIDVPYLWHGGLVRYEVGQVTYELGLRHKFTNESQLNTTNVQRNLSMLWPTADVICLGHRHYNDLQQIKKPLREQVWLRAGSYQRDDDFGMSIGHYRGSWGVPFVILFPDDRCVLPIYGTNFYKGLRMLEFWRREYSRREV